MSKRIGILLGEIEHPYSYQGLLLESARVCAQEKGCHLVVFMGHGASTVRWGDFSHTGIYHLAGSKLIDGLIITPPVVSLLSHHDLDRFLAELPPVPKVLVGRNPPGQACITVDNRAGMRDLMDHLFREHGPRQVACIRGPADNQDACERFEEYRAGLERHGAVFDPRLVFEGNFTSADGFLGARTLIETQHAELDVIIAANDEMAIGAMDYIHSSGRKVPRDIAVYGFDDIRSSRDCIPPLTTIRQPLEELMPCAIDLLLDLMETGQPRKSTLPTRLVIRESCGCSRLDTPDPGSKNLPGDTGKARFDEMTAQYSAMTEMNLLIRQVTTTRTIQDLLGLLDQDLPRLGIGSYSLSCCAPASGSSSQSMGLLDNLSSALGKAPCGNDRNDILLPLFPEGMRILAAKASPTPAHPEELRIPAGTPCTEATGTSAEWLEAMGSQSLLVLPLVTVDSWLGVVLFPFTRENSFYCYGLHDLLANLLDREYRIRELLEQGMRERVSRLAEEEKMKSLNSLVVGVSHEINTPVGIGITSASFMNRLLDDATAMLASGTPDHGALEGLLADARTSMGLIGTSLGKVKALMDRFKSLAMNLSEEAPINLDTAVFLRTQLDSFRQSLVRKDLEFTLDAPPGPAVRVRMGALALVIQSLLENAAKHAYTNKQGGRIILLSRYGDETLILEVRDYGQGMSPDIRKNIFEPYSVMRREGGGMGIGMHIAWTLATFKLKGSLACESNPGSGTTFTLRIPLNPDAPQTDKRERG